MCGVHMNTHVCGFNCVGVLVSNCVGTTFYLLLMSFVPSVQECSANFMWHRLRKSRARIKWDAKAQPRDTGYTLCRTQEARLAAILPES